MRASDGARFELGTQRLGPLPLVNHFIDRLGLHEILARFVPTRDRRVTLAYAKGLGVLLRSIVVEREPIYRRSNFSGALGAWGSATESYEHAGDRWGAAGTLNNMGAEGAA